jgi:hypothetical protein
MRNRYQLVDLSHEQAWDPHVLLQPSPEQIWGKPDNLVSVGKLAAYLPATGYSSEPLEVVQPASIDVVTGNIRRLRGNYTGPHYRMGHSSESLQIGDVLVPRRGSKPALIVTENLRATKFSEQFYALRPVEPSAAPWLWAALSCQEGLEVRTALEPPGRLAGLSVNDLLAMPIPSPVRANDSTRLFNMGCEAGSLDLEAAPSSWWAVRQLGPDGQWAPSAFFRDPAIFDRGTPLTQVADVVRGRRVSEPAHAEEPGLLPVMEAQVVGGRPPRWWTDDPAIPEVASGDVIIQTIGRPPKVSVADRAYRAADSVLIVRPKQDVDAAKLAIVLQSRGFRDMLASIASGIVVPRIAASDLQQLPIDWSNVTDHHKGSNAISSGPPLPTKLSAEIRVARHG